ncbi:MAG: IPT/TIG domain-containing protein [Bacteroidota bacterium]
MKLMLRLARMLVFAIIVMACSKDNEATVVLNPIVEDPDPIKPPAKPKLGEVSPLTGPKGTLVRINGENFGTDASEVAIYFNHTQAETFEVQEEQIEVAVPPRAYSGKIKLELRDTVLVGPEFNYVLSDTVVNTVAGSSQGHADGFGSTAKFYNPTGIAVDANGNVFIADSGNHRIRKITPDGEVTTYAGGEKGSIDGPALEARFNAPWDVDVDAEGNVYVADSQNHRIRKISPDGNVITLAGSDQGNANGVGKDAQFDTPRGVAVTPDGVVYVADSNNNSIRKIDKEQQVTRFPGGFGTLTGIEVGQDGYVYIVSFSSHSIWKIHYENTEIQLMAGNNGEGDFDGTIGTAFNHPKDVAVDNLGNLYITDDGNNKIRMITQEGRVSTYAGGNFGTEDGPVATAQFKHPYGLAVTPEGEIHIADTANNRIRKITQE